MILAQAGRTLGVRVTPAAAPAPANVSMKTYFSAQGFRDIVRGAAGARLRLSN